MSCALTKFGRIRSTQLSEVARTTFPAEKRAGNIGWIIYNSAASCGILLWIHCKSAEAAKSLKSTFGQI